MISTGQGEQSATPSTTLPGAARLNYSAQYNYGRRLLSNAISTGDQRLRTTERYLIENKPNARNRSGDFHRLFGETPATHVTAQDDFAALVGNGENPLVHPATVALCPLIQRDLHAHLEVNVDGRITIF
jgi:hypothetical protein